MNIFQLEHTIKRRGSNFVLGPLDLRLSPGEILGVMGPNGAGKTTLLRLLWGFLRPDSGRVSVFGKTPHMEQVSIRLQAGYLPESLRFYDWMTVERFLDFMAGFYPSWDWSRAVALLEQFGLARECLVGTLSRGNRVRLGLVAAMAHRPQLLILDEPTSGLDPLIRISILQFLNSLAAKSGAGIVMSSHVTDDLDRIADSVLMLHNGKVLEYAPTQVLLERSNKPQLESVFLDAVDRISSLGVSHRA
jgi:ABC-2 type transport system ATP-binding protein